LALQPRLAPGTLVVVAAAVVATADYLTQRIPRTTLMLRMEGWDGGIPHNRLGNAPQISRRR
jgi:hypothetical protein